VRIISAGVIGNMLEWYDFSVTFAAVLATRDPFKREVGRPVPAPAE
jgi:hypothetical protein